MVAASEKGVEEDNEFDYSDDEYSDEEYDDEDPRAPRPMRKRNGSESDY